MPGAQPTTDGNFMHGYRIDRGANMNSYWQTDEQRHPSSLRIWVDDRLVGETLLPDDPCDSRGVLSWHAQENPRRLVEAGSYGYLTHVSVPSDSIAAIVARGGFKLKLEVAGEHEGGLALYGRNAGRYPIDIAVRIS